MLKRTIILILSLLFVFAFSGCSRLYSVYGDKTPTDGAAAQAVQQEAVQGDEQPEVESSEKESTSSKKPTSLTKSEAQKIAKELVERYSTYENIGIACDLYYDTNMSQEKLDAINNMLSEDQKQYLGGIPQKSLCCKTYKDAVAHTKRCIDSSLLRYTTKDYVEYSGNVYFFMGNVGSTMYVNISVESYNNDKIIARADMLNSGDMYCETYEFTIEKVSGNYKVMKVNSLGEIK